MTIREAYNTLATSLATIYDDREGSTIARYLTEDLFLRPFWSEDELEANEVLWLEQALNRLMKYEPWQYVGGQADFFGLKFNVDQNVLIPRPETEELVMHAIEIIRIHDVRSVLDIGTGSGIIPITLALKSKAENLFGTDISPAALKVAATNNTLHQTPVAFIHNDFLDQATWPLLPQIDLLISNPPYITNNEKSEMDANVLDYEPHIALFVRSNAMEFYKAIATFVMKFQNEGCKILVEINEKYGIEVCDTFSFAGLENVLIMKDMQGKDRIVAANKPKQ